MADIAKDNKGPTNVSHLETTHSYDDGLAHKAEHGVVDEYVVDPVLEAKLVRKIDMHMLPMLWVCYM
ncbi:uncharacterized protein LOC62_05G007692 [Vanrija pseudolonga]|uniref:Uncharacterized protein n=1 Tax=Vanrija pseudolonga TaxID=143232 RepID=A0AAF0YG03_9TREE|nr:hypothetical protein LOC62_05G007692 [Vanrija pseudolonga]